MAHLMTFRVWYKDGSARMVSAVGHREAAGEAQELAHLDNAPAPARGHEDYPRYVAAVRVVKTENMSDGSVTKWKA